MNIDAQSIYRKWCENAKEDLDIEKELKEIKGQPEEIEERFYKYLAFGTAGMRGLLGAGTNRMNIYVVGKVTQALCNNINNKKEGASVAISYDSRKKSKLFAKIAAGVFAANGLKVYIYRELMPVPTLSFAVRFLKCSAGIMITASHNSCEYNGYKVYGNDGCQIGEEEASNILEIFSCIDIWRDVKKLNFDDALKNGIINYIDSEVTNKYLKAVGACLINKEVLKSKDFKVLYTPLNGAGSEPVKMLFDMLEFKNFMFVQEQRLPDENFTTCTTPNPETKQALDLGLKYCQKYKPDVLIATDPDADRVGVAVAKDKNGEYKILNGNEIGVLMFSYICEQKSKFNTMPKNPIAIKTIVSTKMVEKIAKKYAVELRNVLTGFKYIGKQITELEKNNQQDRFIFGFEESNGYLNSSYVRDKDGVFAAIFLCEIVAYYKNKSMSILDVLNNLYETYGYFKSSVLSFYFDGKQGMQKMENIMQNLRAKKLTKIGDFNIVRRTDYLEKTSFNVSCQKEEKINFVKSNVLQYELDNSSEIVVRPSGTEPKIKLYFNCYGETKKEVENIEKELKESFKINI